MIFNLLDLLVLLVDGLPDGLVEGDLALRAVSQPFAHSSLLEN